jgi:ribosomal RNA-processing protein 1
MSDKSKIQLELAKKISKLIWKLKDSLKIFAFLKAYFQTLAREWNGIDSRRLDKFYSLSRQIFKEILTISAKEPGLVSGFISLLRQGFLDNSNPKLPLGLLYHSTEAFVEEMIHVENYDVAWIEMYYGMFSTKDLVLYNRLLEVFEKIFKGIFQIF